MATPTTMQTLRQMLGLKLGTFDVIYTSATPTGPDPARWLIMDTAATGSAGSGTSRSDPANPDAWRGRWVCPGDLGAQGEVRRIVHAADGGAYAVDRPFSATVAGSVAVEVTSPLPSVRAQAVFSLSEAVWLALHDTWADDLVNLTTVANQREYSLSAYTAWLNSEDQVIDLLDPKRSLTTPRRKRPRKDWEIRFDGGTPTLAFLGSGYGASGFTFQLAVRRPCYSLVSGAESAIGPTPSQFGGYAAWSETVLCDADEVVEVARMHAWRWLAGWDELTTEKRAEYAKLAAEQEPRVRRLRHYDGHERPMPATTEAA